MSNVPSTASVSDQRGMLPGPPPSRSGSKSGNGAPRVGSRGWNGRRSTWDTGSKSRWMSRSAHSTTLGASVAIQTPRRPAVPSTGAEPSVGFSVPTRTNRRSITMSFAC